MTEAGAPGAAAAPPRREIGPGLLIAELRARGAERFDPVGFRFIEALARHRGARPAGTAGVLDRRLADALADYGARFARAEREAAGALARGTARFPEAAAALRQHCDAGDFAGLHRLLARLEAQEASSPLGELLAHVARHSPQGAGGVAADAGGATLEPPGELKALAYFRSTWSRLSADRQLSRAFAQAPENAGPLNSHFLVLQALKLMRSISPEYLQQFISHANALLWLDQADSGRGPAQKGTARGEGDRKRKSGRGNAG